MLLLMDGWARNKVCEKMLPKIGTVVVIRKLMTRAAQIRCPFFNWASGTCTSLRCYHGILPSVKETMQSKLCRFFFKSISNKQHRDYFSHTPHDEERLCALLLGPVITCRWAAGAVHQEKQKGRVFHKEGNGTFRDVWVLRCRFMWAPVQSIFAG